ncbi:MAG: DUF6077 domain-containing protein [Clostridia bacterium]|nr:DUF6077 domain-containing protein [Clostridia bacterium]
MILKSFVIILIMLLASFLTGTLLESLIRGKHDVVFGLVSGFLFLLALYQLICAVMGIWCREVDVMTVLWLIVTAIICVVSVILNFNKAKECIYDMIYDFDISNIREKLKWQHILLCFIIVIQIVCVEKFYSPDLTADEYFLAAATQRFDTGYIDISNPYTGSSYQMTGNLSYNCYITMVAGISRLIGMHPAAFVHGPWAVVIILMIYTAMFVFGRLVLDDNKDISIFLVIATLIFMFTAYSKDSLGFLAYAAIWQGKIVFATVVVPALIYYAVAAMDRGRKMRLQGGSSNWIYVIIGITASIMLTSMGALFAPVLVGCTAVYYSLHDKNIKNMGYCILSFVPVLLYLIAYFK